jgi:hypothetical protein
MGLSPNASAMSHAINGMSSYNTPPYEIFGVPATGPLAGPLPAIGNAVSSAFRGLGDFLTSEAPNFPITTDQFGNPLQQRDPLRKSYPMDPNAYGPDTPTRPVLDNLGKVVGYEPLYPNRPTASQANGGIAPTQTTNVANGGMASGAGSLAYTPGKGLSDQINYLEQSFDQRYADAVTSIWGTPDSTGNYKVTPENNYLGISPGFVPARTPVKPGPNASYEELRKYHDALVSQIGQPLYKPNSVDEVLSKMDDTKLKDIQKQFLAAHLYSSNAPVTFGDKGNEERSIMAGLMARANYNGTNWETQLQYALDRAKTAPGGYGSGGGGGGGGGGSTQVQYSMTSMADARRILTSVLQSTLGRIPTDSELSDFLSQLNAAEAKSPTTTVTTTAGNKSISRTTPGSVDANNMALTFAKKIGGGGEYDENRAQYYLNLIAKRYGYGFGQG